jgi:hypothetical protein
MTTKHVAALTCGCRECRPAGWAHLSLRAETFPPSYCKNKGMCADCGSTGHNTGDTTCDGGQFPETENF